MCSEEEAQSHRDGEWKQAGCDRRRDQAMQFSGIATVQYDPMIGGGNQQYAQADKHQAQSRELRLLCVRRHPAEAWFEEAAEAKADEDLNSEYQNSGLVQRVFDLVFQLGQGSPQSRNRN